MVSLVGCQIILSDNNLQLDMFQIVDQQRGTSLKWLVGQSFKFYFIT